MDKIKNKETNKIQIDKALIKQFARKIYDSIKQEMFIDKEKCDLLLDAIFGEIKEEIYKVNLE